MKNKNRSLLTVLLLAVSGFGGLVFLTANENGYRPESDVAEVSYGMDVELKWIADGQQADFALVQDTLSYYATAFGLQGTATSSRFQLDHCCEDVALRSDWTNGADFYHMTFAADFNQPRDRDLLLGRLVESGMMQPGKINDWFGMTKGNVSFRLPIPGHEGQFLKIQESQFTMTFVPRLSVDPEA